MKSAQDSTPTCMQFLHLGPAAFSLHVVCMPRLAAHCMGHSEFRHTGHNGGLIPGLACKSVAACWCSAWLLLLAGHCADSAGPQGCQRPDAQRYEGKQGAGP